MAKTRVGATVVEGQRTPLGMRQRMWERQGTHVPTMRASPRTGRIDLKRWACLCPDQRRQHLLEPCPHLRLS